MRGYFGVGVEGISKSYNLGAVLRTSNAFGASFAFTIGATHSAQIRMCLFTSGKARAILFYPKAVKWWEWS
jgi:tRNA G18 (ribose-2'-O)-methylase SpoU